MRIKGVIMKNMRLFVLVILFVVVISIESILIIYLLTNSTDKSEPVKVKTIDEIKENEEIKKLRSLPYEHGNVVEITYTHGNNRTGLLEEFSLKRVTSTYRIFTSEKTSKNSKTTVKEYTIDPTEYKKIFNYLAEYNLPAWSTLKEKEELDGDGEYRTYKFYYNDEKYKKSKREGYIVSFSQDIPDGGHKILAEFSNLLYNTIKDKNLLKESVKN